MNVHESLIFTVYLSIQGTSTDGPQVFICLRKTMNDCIFLLLENITDFKIQNYNFLHLSKENAFSAVEEKYSIL